jgi:hypothetical protein
VRKGQLPRLEVPKPMRSVQKAEKLKKWGESGSGAAVEQKKHEREGRSSRVGNDSPWGVKDKALGDTGAGPPGDVAIHGRQRA